MTDKPNTSIPAKALASTPGPWAVHPLRASVYVVPAEHCARPIGAAANEAYDLAHYAQEICLLHWPDRHRDEAQVKANARLIAAAPTLYTKVAIAATIFREYERLHREKGTPDGDRKAERNAEYAAEMEAALAEAKGQSHD